MSTRVPAGMGLVAFQVSINGDEKGKEEDKPNTPRPIVGVERITSPNGLRCSTSIDASRGCGRSDRRGRDVEWSFVDATRTWTGDVERTASVLDEPLESSHDTTRHHHDTTLRLNFRATSICKQPTSRKFLAATLNTKSTFTTLRP